MSKSHYRPRSTAMVVSVIASDSQLLQISKNFRYPMARAWVDDGAVVITYEYPLIERMRPLLRDAPQATAGTVGEPACPLGCGC